MTRLELREALSLMEISQAALAELVDVTPRAVSLWMSGTRPVPGAVAAYISLLANLPLGARQAELARLEEGTKTMKDGMYQIAFAGNSGQGVGTLVFDSGVIFGIDVGNGQYDGSYEFNEQSGLVDIKIRVQMPAGERSVIGIVQPFPWILEISTEIDPSKDEGQVKIRNELGAPLIANYKFLRHLPAAAA